MKAAGTVEVIGHSILSTQTVSRLGPYSTPSAFSPALAPGKPLRRRQAVVSTGRETGSKGRLWVPTLRPRVSREGLAHPRSLSSVLGDLSSPRTPSRPPGRVPRLGTSPACHAGRSVLPYCHACPSSWVRASGTGMGWKPGKGTRASFPAALPPPPLGSTPSPWVSLRPAPHGGTARPEKWPRGGASLKAPSWLSGSSFAPHSRGRPFGGWTVPTKVQASLDSFISNTKTIGH